MKELHIIFFGMYLTGHDFDTVKQMYSGFQKYDPTSPLSARSETGEGREEKEANSEGEQEKGNRKQALS
jgi:hypothetical protein